MADLFVGKTLNYVIEIFDRQDPPQPAQVEVGSVVSASSDETVMTVQPGVDGLSGSVTGVAPNQKDADGNDLPVRMTVSADADLGTGVETITGVSEDVTVTVDPATRASTFNIRFTAPAAPTP